MQVEQIDRDAAAEVAALTEMRELIREGRADHHAEPFARHRHQARAEVVGEIIAWLEDYDPLLAGDVEHKFGERAD